MPTFDISRVAFNPLKHYTSVRMQQGRVLMDDDWNESARINDEEQRRTQVDVIGGYGSPDDGFRIVPGSVDISSGKIDFTISHGVIYLGGLRLEMDQDETFRLQGDWLEKDDKIPPVPTLTAASDPEYSFVYLEAWQQAVSAVEDSSLLEEALGGPDTTTRMRNMRRVKIAAGINESECAAAWKKLRTSWKDTSLGVVKAPYELTTDARLVVSATGTGDSDNICTPSTAGGYLGAENQAISVQITDYDPIAGNGHFTWGFDNAAPLYRVTFADDGSGTHTSIVQMITPPKDQYHWPMGGQVVEILAWSSVLPNNEKIACESGFLGKVTGSYDPAAGIFKIDATAMLAGFGQNWMGRNDAGDLGKPGRYYLNQPGVYYYMRVWNRGSDTTTDARIPFKPGANVPLGNTGLQVQFKGTEFTPADDPDNEAKYLWVIAARPATPSIVVPWELTSPAGVAPNGTRLFYAPLAIIKWTFDTPKNQVTGEVIHDCRKHFRPLTDQECCCTYTVGDGVNSSGDFNSIQDAIDALPADGGKICILRGIHQTNAVIDELQQVHIYGCGEQSIVCTPDNNEEQIFLISNSQSIKIDNLTLVTFNGIAIDVEDDDDPAKTPSRLITIRDNRILAFIHAIKVKTVQNIARNHIIEIVHNLIGMYDNQDPQGNAGDTAIFTTADEVLIERNRIIVIPEPDQVPPSEIPPPGQPDPCDCNGELKKRDKLFEEIVSQSLNFITAYTAGISIKSYTVPGGIQVGGGSERVRVLQNTVIGGNGSGIILGHKFSQDLPDITALYDITIDGNFVYEMGLSGIGTVLQPDPNDESAFVFVDQLIISRNSIMFCVQGDLSDVNPLLFRRALPFAAISLTFCESCDILENWVEKNGINQQGLVSGIFIFWGEDLDISGNYIKRNGPGSVDGIKSKMPCAGIVIFWAVKLPGFENMISNQDETIDDGFNETFAARPIPAFDASPAAKIHNNIVTQPLGQALFMMALGAVSVVGNQFASQGIIPRNSYSLLAGCVFIFDLGLSKDIFSVLLGPLPLWRFSSPATGLAAIAVNSQASDALFKLLGYWPTGKIMYSANQSVLDLHGNLDEITISTQLMFSLDDIAFVDNQSETAGYVGVVNGQGGVDIVLVNAMLLSVSTRCSNNRFTDGYSYTFYSLLSLALVNTAIGNQSTHCLIVPYIIYRRKALNIELNLLECSKTANLMERLIGNPNPAASNSGFDVSTN